MNDNDPIHEFVGCVKTNVFYCNCQCETCLEIEASLERAEARRMRHETPEEREARFQARWKKLEEKKMAEFQNGKSLNSNLFSATGGRCWYCGVKLRITLDVYQDSFTRDHIIPNGDNSPSNLVAACHSCNSKKNNKPVSNLRKKMAGIPYFNPTQKQWVKENVGIDIDTDERFSGSWFKFYGETL